MMSLTNACAALWAIDIRNAQMAFGQESSPPALLGGGGWGGVNCISERLGARPELVQEHLDEILPLKPGLQEEVTSAPCF